MPLILEGSCRCGAVRFGVSSHAPYPYQLCYCSICRKTAGGGGFAINLSAAMKSSKSKGASPSASTAPTLCDEDGGNCEISTGERNFCKKCASALWLFDPCWPELVHPFASIIDTPLPVPPARTHLMLRYKADLGEARHSQERPHLRPLPQAIDRELAQAARPVDQIGKLD